MIEDGVDYCDGCGWFRPDCKCSRPLRGDYVPTLLDYARVIEWMEDHHGEAMPGPMRRIFADALNRAHLGRIAAMMRENAGLDGE